MVAAFEAWPRRTRRRASVALVLATAATYSSWSRHRRLSIAICSSWCRSPSVALAASIRAQPAPPRAPSWWSVARSRWAPALDRRRGAEYLDWNRARWRAIAYLASDLGAGREQIDGGFEYGGWLNFDARFRHDRRGTSWWWVVDDRYAVAFEPIQGYDVLQRFPYRGWFGLVEDDIVALERSTRRRDHDRDAETSAAAKSTRGRGASGERRRAARWRWRCRVRRASRVAAARSPPQRHPMIVVGVDGADWAVIEELWRQGRLPALRDSRTAGRAPCSAPAGRRRR